MITLYTKACFGLTVSNCVDTKEMGVAPSTHAQKSHHLCAPSLLTPLFIYFILEEKSPDILIRTPCVIKEWNSKAGHMVFCSN